MSKAGDHSLDYADFEGEIDKGYGAGRVIVWEAGTVTSGRTIDEDVGEGR